MQLKTYQVKALEALTDFFGATSRLGKPSLGFADTTERLYSQSHAYQPFPPAPSTPYVCIRLPTGGGKTLVAAHAISAVAETYCRTEAPAVVWLVPTTKILEQTLRTLQDKTHPYHKALAAQWPGVRIGSVRDALTKDMGLGSNAACVIVGTIQGFRVQDKEGRKVYSENSYAQAAMASIPEAARTLAAATPLAPTLANLLAVKRPIIIVDEAHNSTTELSHETLGGLQPSAIVEFTATPAKNSNVLFVASAAELKAEHMVKIPIYLETSQDWRRLLADAVAKRDELDDLVRNNPDGRPAFHPLILFQAQPRSSKKATLDYESIERHLKEDFGFAASEIAVSVGDRDELADGVDLGKPDSPIRCIITQSKLREGWDCPQAYVLVSIAEQQGKTAVEQILGRVMRMPGATRWSDEALNRSYAFISSRDFQAAAQQLRDSLVENGFDPFEAASLVRPLARPIDLAVQDLRPLDLLPAALARKAQAVEVDGRLQILGEFTAHERQAIERAYPDAVVETVPRPRRGIELPLLACRQGQGLRPFDAASFLGESWSPLALSGELPEQSFAREAAPDSQAGTIDVADGGLTIKRRAVPEQMRLVEGDHVWPASRLAGWLARRIRHHDVRPADFRDWLAALLGGLDRRGFDLAYLSHEKYRLRDAIEEFYRQLDEERRTKAWRRSLGTTVSSSSLTHRFDGDGDYPYNRASFERDRFARHLFEVVGDLDNAEEAKCAEAIDGSQAVDTWVRNLDRAPGAFWLQLPTGRFYPDFIVRLRSGKVLVVEYKGLGFATTEDTRLKQEVGERWAAQAGQGFQFLMLKGPHWEPLHHAMPERQVQATP